MKSGPIPGPGTYWIRIDENHPLMDAMGGDFVFAVRVFEDRGRMLYTIFGDYGAPSTEELEGCEWEKIPEPAWTRELEGSG